MKACEIVGVNKLDADRVVLVLELMDHVHVLQSFLSLRVSGSTSYCPSLLHVCFECQ